MDDSVTVNISIDTFLNSLGTVIWVARTHPNPPIWLFEAANELIDTANNSLIRGLITEDQIEASMQRLSRDGTENGTV